jgi:hypothetical protein
MRWLVRRSDNGAQGRVIGGERTLNAARETALNWLDRHPDQQRVYAVDTRKGRSVPINRRRKNSITLKRGA